MKCRSCSSERTEMFLDLGDQPHCNRLIDPGEPDPPSYPLRLWFCHDCTLVQIDHTIPKEEMFLDYPYVSGTTATLVEHFRESAERLTKHYLKPGDLVVDIGSNDGTWLAQYPAGINRLGVEPSHIADRAAVRTIKAFFDERLAAQIFVENRGPAKLITAAGVFFHLEDLHSVIRGIKRLLADDGVLVIQALYLGSIIENGAFDQVYHEHLCYYTVTSLRNLLKPYGLTIISAELLPIHGGTIEVHVCKGMAKPQSASVVGFLYEEEQHGLDRIEVLNGFANRCLHIRADLSIAFYKTLIADGKTIYAYGAPAKGATLLNSCGIGADLVPCAVEKNPLKFGKIIPGCRIPIVDEATADKPDVYLLLAWNFAEEIFAKEAEFIANGGRFLVPFPTVHMVP